MLCRACSSSTVAAGGGVGSIRARFDCRPSPSPSSSSSGAGNARLSSPSSNRGAVLPSSSSSSRTRWTNSGSSETWMPASPSCSSRAYSFRFAAGFGSSVAHLYAKARRRRIESVDESRTRAAKADIGKGKWDGPDVQDLVVVQRLVHHGLFRKLRVQLLHVGDEGHAARRQDLDCGRRGGSVRWEGPIRFLTARSPTSEETTHCARSRQTR